MRYGPWSYTKIAFKRPPTHTNYIKTPVGVVPSYVYIFSGTTKVFMVTELIIVGGTGGKGPEPPQENTFKAKFQLILS